MVIIKKQPTDAKKTKFSAKAQLLWTSPSVISAMVSFDKHHSRRKHQSVNFIFMYWRSNRSGFVLLKVLMSPVSVGSSFLVVCLVSYPAAAAAAAGPDQGRSSLCHDRQTDLQREIKRAKEGERNFCSFLLAVIIIQTDFSPPKKILYDNDLGSDIVVLQKHK